MESKIAFLKIKIKEINLLYYMQKLITPSYVIPSFILVYTDKHFTQIFVFVNPGLKDIPHKEHNL